MSYHNAGKQQHQSRLRGGNRGRRAGEAGRVFCSSADRIGRCLPSLALQIFLWEQNLEQFHMDLFRFRCYLASLQGGELPNPKRLLAVASRPTKLAMGRLGIFSVSSFHTLVNGFACAALQDVENVALPPQTDFF